MNRILILDDDQAVLNYFRVLLLQTGRFEVEALSDSTKAFGAIDSGGFDLLLLDMDMPGVTGREVLEHVRRDHPGLEVVIITGVEDVELAVESMKMGAYDYLCKPVDDSRLLTTLDRALERSRLRGEIDRLRDRIGLEGLAHREAFQGILTQDRRFVRTLRKVEQIAASDNNVLIWGESGTGKELVARAIHRIGRRRDRAFVAVNAGTLASELFASEFFGHDRGAFTGAVRAKAGLFEEADGGILFLDEIGELELPVQAKLLRVLQSGEYFRLGSTRERGADVRIVAATNKDLEAEIARGRFRRDLYYRLNISSIYLLPLRDRRGDVELLAHHFLEKHARLNGKSTAGISDEVMALLEGYDYPGNVRELENIIAGAVVLETGGALGRHSLPPYLVKAVARAEPSVPPEARKTLEELEAEHVRAVLVHAGGNRTAAAAVLGISRVGLLAKMKKYGITVDPASRGGGRRPARGAPAGDEPPQGQSRETTGGKRPLSPPVRENQ
ncbi:MAG TPA: sigma-54 dependent transcriptional regulator [Candidatus Aquicultoraceae bacterium]|nr:sigma-54 dependent transcriptional regulator [Candidatus Aquicultoraceae bacterium]